MRGQVPGWITSASSVSFHQYKVVSFWRCLLVVAGAHFCFALVVLWLECLGWGAEGEGAGQGRNGIMVGSAVENGRATANCLPVAHLSDSLSLLSLFTDDW